MKEISMEQLQALLDYLQKQPYNQVHELIHNILIIANKE